MNSLLIYNVNVLYTFEIILPDRIYFHFMENKDEYEFVDTMYTKNDLFCETYYKEKYFNSEPLFVNMKLKISGSNKFISKLRLMS